MATVTAATAAVTEAMMGGTTMDERRLELVHPPSTPEKRSVIPSQVLGTSIFVLTEIMMFAGFLSAFNIAKSSAPVWPPVGQPRLPIETTGLNTLVLLSSAGLLYLAWKRFQESPERANLPMLGAIVTGTFFVVFQGFEWASLIRDGLTLTSTSHGSFFYVIVGMHAIHVTGALAVFFWVYSLLRQGTLTAPGLRAMQIYWYFVVGLWPILYWQVYL